METKMERLNLMGNPVGQVKNQPKYGGGQIINVTYGHHGGGKLYSYYGTNKRAGDIVTPEVTHPKSGKTYKTLAVVRSTHNAGLGQETVDYVTGKTPNRQGEYIKKPTGLKWIGKTDQKSLPGYYEGWDKDADAAYELKLEAQKADIPQMQRLSLMREINSMRRQDIKNHKKGE